ncbi:tetratricopeptide repeat protein [Hymenobacter ruricola]|uniref:histidine kinase n=1 Tax=Hymenobacter ruricola TaxID=2791023 RepID=A0ABS0I3E2_9BACT|nr:tetratricopeptide repeat protein [Hymenobacter ruricola]MBF9221493.1 tetratricopeptide repeat protein [Hymenobacter ruricola]
MRRFFLAGALLAGLLPLTVAQTPATDSLRRAYLRTPADSGRVLALLRLAYSFRASRPDSAMALAQQAWQLAQRLEFDKGRGRAQGMMGVVLRERGELPKAYANQLIALQISRKTHDLEGEAASLNALGNISFDLRQYRQAIRYYEQARALFERTRQPAWVAGALTNLGSSYEQLNVLDSALLRQRQAQDLMAKTPRPRLAEALALRNMGLLQARLGHFPEAFGYYRRALREAAQTNDLRNQAVAQYRLADLFNTLHQPDSSLQYARRALQTARRVSYRITVLDAGNLLARLYQDRQQPDSAYHYQRLAVAARDSLFGPEKYRQLQLLAFTEQQRQLRQREAHELQTASYQRMALLAALGFCLLIALLLWRSNRQQRRANRLLNERNAQIEAQRNALDEALTELRTMQAQLVAAEKWSFVGELSAGIAHELQNPLAFMRNFAAVSEALLEQEPTRPGADGLEQKIMAGLKQNLREISEHGQRASSIITNMLAHARTGTGQREPTDLNALLAENLRLATLGTPTPAGAEAVRWDTQFAPDLGPVAAVPEELGRAFLNLFTNALHAVRSRQQTDPAYHPAVSVRTQRTDGAVEIRVRDNGTGMTEDVAAQVFQPFFTTKSAGEGTGLGLSLSHDIITKGHSGTLTVETREGEFTEFLVRLPA